MLRLPKPAKTPNIIRRQSRYKRNGLQPVCLLTWKTKVGLTARIERRIMVARN